MKIIELPVERKFPIEGELAERINELICEYDGQISTVAALGILEMVKQRVIGKLITNHTEG